MTAICSVNRSLIDGDESNASGHTYESVGGLFAAEAIDLLKDFYEQGNPNGETQKSLR